MFVVVMFYLLRGRCCPEVLLLLITYVFSVAFMTFSRGTPLEKGAFQSMGLSGNGTDHEGNSSRPGKMWWIFDIEGILDFQRIRELEVPFKKLPCIIIYDLHGSWHHAAGVQMPCVPGCFFPRSCWARGLADGFVGPALHPLWIFDSHEHVARIEGGKGNWIVIIM